MGREHSPLPWVVVGARFVLRHAIFSKYIYTDRIATIEKVHKNGRVKLSGQGNAQFTPDRFGGTSLWRTYSVGWDSEVWELITPEVEAEMQREARVDEARGVVLRKAGELNKIARSGGAEAILSAVQSVNEAPALRERVKELEAALEKIERKSGTVEYGLANERASVNWIARTALGKATLEPGAALSEGSE